MVSTVVPEVDTRSFRLGSLFVEMARSRKELNEMFDKTPIFEVREACLKQKGHAESEEDVRWTISRIWKFLNISMDDHLTGKQVVEEDFETVFLLLRNLVYAPEQYQKKVFAVMLEVLGRALHPKRGDDHISAPDIKEAVVVMCGHLMRRPEHYNERARRLLRDMLENGTAEGGEDQSRMIQRLLLIVGLVGDISFLPVVETFALPMSDPKKPAPYGSFAYQLKYFSVSRERLITGAVALQVAAYLKHLESAGH